MSCGRFVFVLHVGSKFGSGGKELTTMAAVCVVVVVVLVYEKERKEINEYCRALCSSAVQV